MAPIDAPTTEAPLFPNGELGGRIARHDPRSELFRLRRAISPAELGAARKREYRHYQMRLWQYLVQRGGTCVGHGFRHKLNAGPVMNREAEGQTAYDIYRVAQTLDPWSDQPHEGTTVLAGAQAAVQLGAFDAYGWEYDAQGVMDFMLAGKGPVVIGTDWFEGMLQVDERGFIAPTGRSVGGHCTCLVGVNRRQGVFYGANSWESMRRFKILGEHLNELLKPENWGEACAQIERPLASAVRAEHPTVWTATT